MHSAFAVQHNRLLCNVRKAGVRYVSPSLSTIGWPNPPNVKLIIVTMTFDNLWICICSQSCVSINHFHMIVKAVNAMHRTASWPPSPVSQLDATWCTTCEHANIYTNTHTNTHKNTYNTHKPKLMQHTGLHSRTYPNKQALMYKSSDGKWCKTPTPWTTLLESLRV